MLAGRRHRRARQRHVRSLRPRRGHQLRDLIIPGTTPRSWRRRVIALQPGPNQSLLAEHLPDCFCGCEV